MIIYSEDSQRSISLGYGILFSVYSTLEVRLKHFCQEIPLVEQFLKTGICESENALETARQWNLLRDEFSKISPDKAVYDMTDLNKQAPWSGNLSKVITSCANLYTTDDGQDLLFEIVSILCYADIAGTKVYIQ